ncbi:MAG: DUF1460 domain-containing protein [Ignavibacteriales bacterium]|nr:DUF1460 domain-containing protein [Ignavibacteriales bacterium]
MKSVFLLFFFVMSVQFLFAQECSMKDRETFEKVISQNIKSLQPEASKGQVIGVIGRGFLKTPYVAHTLETDGDEHLVVNLLSLDCTTFLETVFTLTRSVWDKDTSFEQYCKNLTELRYRDGKIDGYPSRLHYFSDWIFNNSAKGLIEDVTEQLGGIPIVFNVGFMSSHPESYKMLMSNPEFVKEIREQEQAINSRQYFCIPKEKVAMIEDEIHEGDFIAITTNLKGLDIGHVGIAVKENGKTKFLHAPQVDSQVQITEDSLSDYLSRVKKHTGIIIFRMK